MWDVTASMWDVTVSMWAITTSIWATAASAWTFNIPDSGAVKHKRNEKIQRHLENPYPSWSIPKPKSIIYRTIKQ